MLQTEKSGVNPDCDLLFQKYNIITCNNDQLEMVIIIHWYPENDRFFFKEVMRNASQGEVHQNFIRVVTIA
jgi:hypothetical protein